MQGIDKYNGKMFILGLGPVAVAFIELIRGNGFINDFEVTVITDSAPEPQIMENQDFNVVWHRFSKDSLDEKLAEFIPANSIIVNCLSEVGSFEIMVFATKQECLYIDSSVENWQGEEDDTHVRQEIVYENRELFEAGPPIIVNHGANPGLVSHFAKAALVNAAELNKKDKPVDWAKLAFELGIHAIHISEIDTQETTQTLANDSFYSTWSVEAFKAESLENSIHAFGSEQPVGDGTLLTLSDGHSAWKAPSIGCETYAESFTPSHGKYSGMVISHIETFTIANLLTSTNENGKAEFRPTVLFCYRPCPASVWSFEKDKWEENAPNILLRDIHSGADEIGISLFSNKEPTIYWYGTTLSNAESRKISPLSNATSVQVAAGLYGGLRAGLAMEKGGLYEPEDIDHETVLDYAIPYLGSVRFLTSPNMNITPHAIRSARVGEISII